MARTILTAVLIVLLNVMVGCRSVDSGKSQLVPTSTRMTPVIEVADTGETDIVEQMVLNRQAYRQGLELLVKFYVRTGNNMKLEWARKELAALQTVPQYNYVIEPPTVGPSLKASALIPEADLLYEEAFLLEKKAGLLPFLKDENLLRMALNKYNQLIEKHTSSDKIDDAAYRAAGIYEYFQDYTIAVLFYKRVYQWDRYTIYPAKYKAAYLLDRKLHQRAEALGLYLQAIKDEALAENYREFAITRIEALTQSEQEIK